MTSKIEICNLALAKIGSDSFIITIDDETKSARHLRIFYNPARDALLRSHLWRFARKRVVLAPDAGQPPFDGGYYFTIPVDCLRIIGTDLDYAGAYGRWHVEGNKIIADTQTLNLVYIYRVEDEVMFDPLFVEAFATKLAHELAMPLTQSAVTKQVMKEEMREVTLRAAHAGATEQDSSAFLSEVFIKAHS